MKLKLQYLANLDNPTTYNLELTSACPILLKVYFIALSIFSK